MKIDEVTSLSRSKEGFGSRMFEDGGSVFPLRANRRVVSEAGNLESTKLFTVAEILQSFTSSPSCAKAQHMLVSALVTGVNLSNASCDEILHCMV